MEKENTVVSNFVDFASGRHAKEEIDEDIMFADAGLRLDYIRMDSRSKAEFLVENFKTLPEQLEAMKELVKVNIICDQEYRRNMGADNIRVQSSSKSDPTASFAIRNVMIDEAIENNSLEDVVKDSRMADQYARILRSIESMEHDLHIVGVFIKLLPPLEKRLLEDYLDNKASEQSICTLAAKYDYQEPRSVYFRIKRIKIKIADWAAPGLDRKYERISA